MMDALSTESFQITDKRTCKVRDLSSPLYSMVVLDTVCSVKDCPNGVSASPCSLTSLCDGIKLIVIIRCLSNVYYVR